MWRPPIERPTAADDDVLIEVRAASVNPLDWRLMRGRPYFGRLIFGLRCTSGSEHVLHAFKTSSEGSDPRAPLTVVNGALYGTTLLGGANGVGTIFKD